jgi:uncharacterized membrane protein (DUF485 family)
MSRLFAARFNWIQEQATLNACVKIIILYKRQFLKTRMHKNTPISWIEGIGFIVVAIFTI